MKIKTKQILIDNEVVSNKVISAKSCCNSLLNEKNFISTKDSNTNDFKICYPVRIIETSWEDTFDDTYYYGMDYCPFCSEKIEIEVVETDNLSEKYKAESEECVSIRRMIEKTDSKNECNKLEKKFRELNNRINSYFTDDDFRDFIE